HGRAAPVERRRDREQRAGAGAEVLATGLVGDRRGQVGDRRSGALLGACGNSPDRHLAVCGGAAGSCTGTQSPPAAPGVRVSVPSCARVMLLTIARPRPTPAWSVRMRSVPRRNGSPSVATNCGMSFSPVFSTVSTTPLG